MQNLSKENFWNILKGMYPDAMDHFCDWIDKYKEEVDWETLFNNNKRWGTGIKFHDLPVEMQIGILGRYEHDISELEGGTRTYEQKVTSLSKPFIEGMFKKLQGHINRGKQL